MVNITTRIIDKKKGYLTGRQGQKLTNIRGKVLLFITQSKYGGERGLFDVTGCLWEKPSKDSKKEQRHSQHRETVLIDWLALHGLLNPFSYIIWDYLPRSGPTLEGRPTHFNHKSIKCPTDMPKGQSDEVNFSIEIPFIGDSCLCKGNINQPVRHACISVELG